MLSVLNNLLEFLETYYVIIISFNTILILILFILLISVNRNFKKFKFKYNKIMEEAKEKSVEKMLCDIFNYTNETSLKNKELEYKLNKIEKNLQHCVQKVGVVRYNAFEGVGSELSYAVALLDNNDDGVVINGIYARESSTTYAKPIKGGNSKHALSAEEIQAIDIARRAKYQDRSTIKN
ncbi:DUF4446 family protein [Acetivibrio saccincola]|uniref:DUF4446 domain-containing protein n=1 Tax=Acetivibrio saccincola TaxID=1677857 RepID=A0A2K9EHM9_9FIRM|nr:DUF4446 family protein [Acetivibrio saccincola]AUG56001.1 hypothetical protein HVS_00045 [Acetivibrio saccincola]NLW27765.1 DUF4446 family protein [Acetivibrio saccincola]PQQ65810.1 hypothetical protein B9R14_02860 [Acetivibrio saccincola]